MTIGVQVEERSGQRAIRPQAGERTRRVRRAAPLISADSDNRLAKLAVPDLGRAGPAFLASSSVASVSSCSKKKNQWKRAASREAVALAGLAGEETERPIPRPAS